MGVRLPNTQPSDSKALERATLYIFSGLPGSGKTTLSQALASRIGAAHLRIDTIEQALRDLCSVEVQGEGYRLAYRVAGDILRSGVGVTADSCNPIELTRREWEQVARDAGVPYVNIEVICSDPGEHRQRVETRRPTVPGCAYRLGKTFWIGNTTVGVSVESCSTLPTGAPRTASTR